jgi:hypothetical protein
MAASLSIVSPNLYSKAGISEPQKHKGHKSILIASIVLFVPLCGHQLCFYIDINFLPLTESASLCDKNAPRFFEKNCRGDLRQTCST